MARPRKPVPPPPSSSTRARLTGVGRARADGSPDVAAIAERIGRSERTVRRYLANDRLPRLAEERVRDLEHADAQRPRWIEAKDEGPTSRALFGVKQTRMPAVQDVHGSLLASFQRPDGTVDTRRASSELGVSQRTVQRWVKGESRTTTPHQAKLRQQVRSSMLEGRRSARQSNKGAQVALTAVVKVSSDVRQRKLGHQSGIRLSGADMASIQQAYTKGGEQAANKALAGAIARSTYGRTAGMDAGSIRGVTEINFRR